ncbi:glycosyl hydrolase [Microbacterium sp. BK668]|uniref:glycosyl hydrolase n=1 Tax=Microbacterium sp. BK668 TaxID=2512118 RepID=UPI0010E67E50|nr:glycosyl hydrolase [Microbacterium sp. BK668]TDN91272.1 alpha-L-rhamnosidase-like protein [Microbacterium sp. BK668]
MAEQAPPAPGPLADLWRAFADPPDDARPRAWWHWMDGNIDPAGIERDLEWLHGAGVRGVQLFDGGVGVPLVVPEPVRPGTDAWTEALDTASRTAAGLGLEFAVATSSGWSAAGGPWVEPADAMKKVVWSELVVDGGGPVDVELPPLPSVAGPFQDAAPWGADPREPWAVDWRVLAFPADRVHERLIPARVTGSVAIADAAPLVDGSFQDAVSLPRDPDAWSSAWLEQEFDRPVTVGSVTVGLPGPRGFGAAPSPDAVLQASDDGALYRDVVVLPASTVPARTAAFPPVTARRFRLVVSGASAADALPPLSDGVRRPPVLRRSDAFVVSEFALRAGGRVHQAEVKAAFGVVPDFYAVDTAAAAGTAAVSPGDVHDLTGLAGADRVTWEAPPGRWQLLRLGASLTGQTNGPAPRDATGLEVDKLDGRRVATYLGTHLERFAPGRYDALLSDSIEAGPQNWTDGIAERFRSMRGYDPTPWLPALAGYVVGGAEASDRFLYDYRRTISELLATEYYGALAAEARARGMAYYAEALEDRRPQLGDDLAMRSHADVPMGAMWTFDPDDGPKPTYVADLKGASSVAHVYGRRWTGAEAFSSFDRPWASTPRSLKHVADLQLALGVTRFCIHTSPHQPVAAPPPGIALAPFLGQAFTRNETWAAMARPWIDYLARCSAVLSSGEPAVDIAVFIGEEAPVTGLFGEAFDASVPDGFDFDYLGVDGLGMLDVDEGRLVAAGARYRVLYLGGSSRRLTVGALRRIRDLLDAGATVVGTRPEGSPSLGDDDDEFARLCDEIWALPRARGRIVPTGDLGAALEELGIEPELRIVGAALRTIARRIDGRRVTFLANPTAAEVRARVRMPRSVDAVSAWDPVEVRSRRLAEAETPEDARVFEVLLPPFGSVFLVPDSGGSLQDEGADERATTPQQPQVDAGTRGGAAECAVDRRPIGGPWTLELPGREPVTLGDRPRMWTELDADARGFSGVGLYRARFQLEPGTADERMLIDLGQVGDLARVRVNGVDCGVAWTAPFRVDVTDALAGGSNGIEVEVATPWRNRLIAEAAAPSGRVFAPMTEVFEPTAAPLPAGLAGPVELVVEKGV